MFKWCLIESLLIGSSLSKTPFSLPESLISFETASLFALGSYCASLYKEGNTEYNCGAECSGAANGTQLVLAYTEPKTKARMIVSYNDKLKSIFFQSKGMQDIKEMLAGFSVLQSKLNENIGFGKVAGIEIHSGFRTVHDELRIATMPKMLKLARDYPDYKIVFVGHSMGGALALLAAVDFFELYGYENRISVYTFGKPRVGNAVWAQYVNQLPFADRIFRLTRHGDPIVLLPPRAFGYEHEFQAYQVQDDGSVLKCDNDVNSGESNECSYPIDSFDLVVHNRYFHLGHTQCEEEGLLKNEYLKFLN
jgi:hypothetical protein